MASLSGAGSGVLLSTNILSLHPLDILIFSAFLLVTLIVGLRTGQHVKTMQDYALGGKNFSTPTLVATIIATWFGGGSVFNGLEKTYSIGLYYNLSLVGLAVGLFLSGQLASRMREFMHNVSVAEAMKDMYGKTAGIITAASGAIAKLGFVAIQFKVISRILVIIFHFDNDLAPFIAAAIVIFYSAFGGIRAVTFTDVVQFLTFGAVIPILGLIIWNNLRDPSAVVDTFKTNPNLNIKNVVGWTPEFLNTVFLFCYFATPALYTPELFQRIAMARNVKQAKSALTYSAGIALLIAFLISWLGILLLTDNPGLEPNQVVAHMVNKYSYPGLKGLIGIGVTALAMSTADSCLNTSSILFANDIVKPLTGQGVSSTKVARYFSVIGGLFSFFLALYWDDLLTLLMLSASLYMPIFAMPMLWAVLGFRTSTRVVLLSMAAGFLTVVVWSILVTNASSVVPGMAVNLLVLLGVHYLLGEPGGWQKVTSDSPLGRERAARKEAWQRRRDAIKNFKLYPYLQQNLPHQEGLYFLLGLYTIAATYTGFYTIGDSNIQSHREIYEGIYHTVIFATTAFLTFPIWPPTFKSYRFMTFFWPLGLGSILFFAGTLLTIISSFHTMQVMVLIINLLIAVLLFQWSLAIILALSGASLAALFFQYYTGEALLWSATGSLQFTILYGLLLVTSLLIVLSVGKHAYTRLDKKNLILRDREKDQQANLVQVSAEKQAALASFQHTGAEKLLAIARDLQKLPVAKEVKEKMQALQMELLPIAFHLQGIDTRAQDYLRLEKIKMTLKSWCDQIKEEITKKGVTNSFHCKHETEFDQINCDPAQLTSLVVNSIVALSAQTEDLEDKPTIFFRLEDTQLSYPLEDVKKGYVKYVPAVRMAITVGDDLPPVKDSYRPELNGSSRIVPETTQDPAKSTNNRIVKSHYGYEEVTEDTLIYVVPVDVEDVRPKDMDKDYMEVGAKPKRADDHFKDEKNGIDAQVQEAAFLADVAARSDADLGMVQMALETIKWYHGPKGRNSGEPFYLHPLTVAHIVLDYNTDEETIIGALLHDTVEDTAMQLEHIEAMFGKKTAEVVDVVTHLQSIEGSIYKIKMSASENLQMLDRTDSKRGLYVKIADRMHNMRTIGGHKKVAKRKLIAQETADFFVPLARKLGLKKAAAEFEKMCYEVFRQQG